MRVVHIVKKSESNRWEWSCRGAPLCSRIATFFEKLLTSNRFHSLSGLPTTSTSSYHLPPHLHHLPHLLPPSPCPIYLPHLPPPRTSFITYLSHPPLPSTSSNHLHHLPPQSSSIYFPHLPPQATSDNPHAPPPSTSSIHLHRLPPPVASSIHIHLTFLYEPGPACHLYRG